MRSLHYLCPAFVCSEYIRTFSNTQMLPVRPWVWGASNVPCAGTGNEWHGETPAGPSKGLQRNALLLSEWREGRGGMPLMSAKWKSEPPGSSLSLPSVRTSRSRWLSWELRSQGAQQLLCFTNKHTPQRNTINLPLSGWENQGLHLHLIEQHRPQEIITPMLISLLYKQDIVDFDSEVNRFTVSIMSLLRVLGCS